MITSFHNEGLESSSPNEKDIVTTHENESNDNKNRGLAEKDNKKLQ
jgi:hypothetical protein